MRAGIVGCGIGGMAAAIALARKGHSVTLFEAFQTPKPLGSGLMLQPSGLAALRAIGLEDQAREAGARIDRLDGRDRSGRRILDLDYGTWRRGTHGVGIRRSALFDLLHDSVRAHGIEVVTAAPIAAIEDYDRPRLRTEDGRVFDGFDLAVIADGSGSRLRGLMRPKAKAPVYPWGAVWANCPDPGLFPGSLRQLYHGTEVMIGVLPVGAGQVSLFWSLPVADQDAFFSGDFAEWKAGVADLWPEVTPILEPLTSAEGFSRAIYRDVSVGCWSRGACVLIGDAAHGTSPQLGQGANLALIDAIELAERLGTGRPARSLARYQRVRRRQTALYQIVSRMLTPLFQSEGRRWLAVRDWLFTPLTRAPILRWFVAGGLTGTGRLGITPKSLRL